MTLAELAVFLAGAGEASSAVTLCGFGRQQSVETIVAGVADALEQMRVQLGDEAYAACLAHGETLSPAQATRLATDLIGAARRKLESPS
jgi:hypothetical protein